MLRVRTIGVALVAVFAFSAMVVASASATLPELVKAKSTCVEHKGEKKFKFTEKECKTESVTKEGEFELEQTELIKKGITSTSGAGTLETAGGTKVKCTADSDVGTASGTKKVVKVVVKFTGCTSTLGVKCTTEKAAAGEIITEELEGEIGYISKAAKTVGLDLWPSSRTAAEKKNHEFKKLEAKFVCAGFITSEVRGSIIGKVTETNKKTTKLTLTYVKGAKAGEQELKKLEGVEGEVEDVLESSLNGGAFEKSNEETTDTNTYEEEVELKA